MEVINNLEISRIKIQEKSFLLSDIQMKEKE